MAANTIISTLVEHTLSFYFETYLLLLRIDISDFDSLYYCPDVHRVSSSEKFRSCEYLLFDRVEGVPPGGSKETLCCGPWVELHE